MGLHYTRFPFTRESVSGLSYDKFPVSQLVCMEFTASYTICYYVYTSKANMYSIYITYATYLCPFQTVVGRVAPFGVGVVEVEGGEGGGLKPDTNATTVHMIEAIAQVKRVCVYMKHFTQISDPLKLSTIKGSLAYSLCVLI